MDKKSLWRMITAIKFNNVPDYGIIDDVKRKDLPVKSLFFENEKQKKKVCKIKSSLIKLHRMKKHAKRDPGEVMSIFVMKCHSPRQKTFPSETATCVKTAQAAKAVTKSESWCNDIRSFPSGDPVFM